MAERLRLDPIRCDGYGMCAEVLPELVTLDDWGYPIIADGPIPPRLLAHARRAVDVCPVLALRLRGMEATGRGPWITGPGGSHAATSANVNASSHATPAVRVTAPPRTGRSATP